MKVRIAVALSALLAAGALAAATPHPAAAEVTCAQTVPTSTPQPACWTEYPYPFGFDGNPVNEDSPACKSQEQANNTVDPIVCYLSVDSMAFRAWNRGIAVTSPPPNTTLSTTPFGVWLYNGTRWFPDPTFPGQSVCQGSTVLWAGKLDYWLVGQIGTAQYHGNTSAMESWPALCRFDGVNFDWEPLSVPKSALAHVPVDPSTGQPEPGAIQTGACTAWNNCWFFGSYGVVLHWDGQSLTDDTPGLGTSPWLQSDFTAAVARTDPAGNPFAFAVAGTSGGANANPGAFGQATPSAPDGSPPPQLYRSSGGPFAPLGFSPPTNAVQDDPYQTDLVAVDFNSQGQGWVAGDPRGFRPGLNHSGASIPTELSPLVPLSATGAAQTCASTPPGGFTYSISSAAGPSGYLWSSIGVLPNGTALAGGSLHSPTEEPVLAQVSCDQPPRLLRFGVADPTTGAITDVDPGGWVTAVAANAMNDAWAAATSSAGANSSTGTTAPTPHLYHLTDGGPPLAPAGDDNESRPQVVQAEPTIFVIAPTVVIPPPPPPTVTTQPGTSTTRKVKVPPPIYAIQRPKLVRGPRGTYALVIRFKVRAKVTIGIEGLRRGKVVTSSGLKTFRGKTGKLVLKVNRKRWPTSLKFIFPKNQGTT